MTDALKRAVHRAETLPEPKQQALAVLINDKVEELQETLETEALARLAESSFAQDWDCASEAASLEIVSGYPSTRCASGVLRGGASGGVCGGLFL